MQRMLRAPPSAATAREKLMMAALAALYPAMYAAPYRPQMDETFTIAPPVGCFFMRLSAVRVPQKVPSTVVAKFECQAAVDVRSTVPTE